MRASRLASLHLGSLGLLLLAAHALVAAPARAASLRDDLVVWQPRGSDLRIVLPAYAQEAPAVAVQRYVDHVNAQGEFRRLMGGATLPLGPSTLQALRPLAGPASPAPRFGVVANEFEHLKPGGHLIELVLRKLREAGADPYVIPIAGEGRMSWAEGLAYRGLLNRSFDALLVLGGQDIDPHLYGEPNRHAVNLNRARDLAEVEILRAYLAGGRGMYFAICRGHQFTQVALGGKLVQDIPLEVRTRTIHRDGLHRIVVAPGTVFAKLVGGKAQLVVNTFHHQAVRQLGGRPGEWKVVAREQDGGEPVVEAAERVDGRALTVQFHPEGMENEDGRAILRRMVDLARALPKR